MLLPFNSASNDLKFLFRLPKRDVAGECRSECEWNSAGVLLRCVPCVPVEIGCFCCSAFAVAHEAFELQVEGRGRGSHAHAVAPVAEAGHTQCTSVVRPAFLFALRARAPWRPSSSEWRCFRAES